MTSEELKEWRREHNLTQADLAKELNVTNVCISRWESGARNIPAFLHLALDCLKVKRKGGEKIKGMRTKTKMRTEVKK